MNANAAEPFERRRPRSSLRGLSIAAALSVGCGSILGSLANRVKEDDPPITPSAASLALHADLLIADLHADPLLLGRDLREASDKEHVDIPRLIRGNVALEGFGVVTKVPKDIVHRRSDLSVNGKDDVIGKLAKVLDWPEEARESLMGRARYMAGNLRAFQTGSGGRFQIITSQAQLAAYLAERQTDPEMTAGLLTLEGAHTLEGLVENVDTLFDAGYRVIGLVHFFDSDIGGSAHGVDRGGLTDFGRDVIERMGELDLVVDLAHASAALFDDVLALIESLPADARPAVLVSHTGVYGTCPNERNLTDDQLRRLVEVQEDAVVGIGFFEYATCGERTADIVGAIRHVADVIGARHVALGSDWDGFVTVPMDAANLAKLTHALVTSGFAPDSIARIMGANAIEFFGRALPAH